MQTLRPGQRVQNIPGIGVTTSRRAVASAAAGWWVVAKYLVDDEGKPTTDITVDEFLGGMSALAHILGGTRRSKAQRSPSCACRITP